MYMMRYITQLTLRHLSKHCKSSIYIYRCIHNQIAPRVIRKIGPLPKTSNDIIFRAIIWLLLYRRSRSRSSFDKEKKIRTGKKSGSGKVYKS